MATATNTAYKLPEIFETLGIPTLKAIALVFNMNPTRIYGVAKTPKEGEVYDAKEYNWEAIERWLLRRLDPDQELASLEDIIMKAHEIDKELVNTDKRRRSEPGGSADLALIEVDGREMPVRKYPNFEANYDAIIAHPAGIHVVLLKNKAEKDMVFGIVYQTRGYTVLQPVGRDGQYSSETPRLISNNLLNLYGCGPSWLTAEEIEKRYKIQDALASAGTTTTSDEE